MGIKYKSGLFTSALTANDIQQQIASLPDLYFLVRQAQFVHDVGDLGKQRRA